MEELRFTIAFHGPFHVGSGDPGAGLDRVLDRDHLLPATSLKGIMRAEAEERLGLEVSWVARVFGDRGSQPGQAKAPAASRRPSPWRWTDAVFDAPDYRMLSRVRVSDEGVASRGFLMLGETVWATSATFVVEQFAAIPANELPYHGTVLRACAGSVSALGGGRRRGEGWCTITESVSWGSGDGERMTVLRSPR